jgi:hypothetical protein
MMKVARSKTWHGEMIPDINGNETPRAVWEEQEAKDRIGYPETI